MSIPGYTDYQRREFCKDIPCPVQVELDKHPAGSPDYEQIRETCKNGCRYTTYEFHHWLIQKDYLIVRKSN